VLLVLVVGVWVVGLWVLFVTLEDGIISNNNKLGSCGIEIVE
jgi:hypothetical protein